MVSLKGSFTWCVSGLAVAACLWLVFPPDADAATTSNAESASTLAQGTWTSAPAGPLSARTQQAAIWTGSDLLIWGGQSVSFSTTCPCSTNMLNNGALFDPRSEKWTVMANSPLSPRDGVASVWTGHVALLWGGQTEDTANTPADSNRGAAFNPSSDRWSLLAASPLSPRDDAIALWTGEEAIFIGGNSPPGATSSSSLDGADIDGATYDPSTRRWTRLPTLPAKGLGAAYGITATWSDHALIAWATFQTTRPVGSNGTQIRTRQLGAEWTPGQRSWKLLPSPPQTVVTADGTSTWLAGRDVVTGATDCIGAMSCPAPITGVAEIYDPARDAWATSPRAPIFIHPDLVVSTGTNLVLINESTEMTGPNLNFSPGDGTIFDPMKNTTTSLPAVPAEDVDTFSSMVWTGHDLLMWGVSANSTRTFGLQLADPRPP